MADQPTTTRIVLASRPQGAPIAANFRLEQSPRGGAAGGPGGGGGAGRGGGGGGGG
ncbi:hypothetical protein I5U77_12095, partial [Stenotrophomonas maltophilia]|nr:hypothetical protein [Stenotrophomonas maltophilia]